MVEHELQGPDVERDVAPERAAVRPADRPRRRGRWLKIVLVVVVLLVLLLALAPVWSAPIARNLVVDKVNEQIDGTLAIESLSWSYGGHVRVEGLDLRDAQGQPVMQIAAVDGHVDVLPALKGDIRAALTVDGLQADLRRQPDGRTNIESIGGGPKGEPKPKTSSGPLPQVAATVRVNDATLRVHGEDGDTELHEVTVALDLKALDQPATFDVGAALSGPGGPAGRVKLTGDVLLAQDGQLSDAPPVRVDYTLDTLRLEALAPAATLFADVPPASGRVGGSGHWEWQGGLRLSGRTELTLQSVRVEGASAGGQPLVVPDTTLTAEAQLDDSGGGRQTLALVSGTLLDLRWDGTVSGLLGERPSLEGALALGGDLGGLFDLAREPLALQPGVGLSGQLAVDTRLRAEWTQPGPQSVAVQGTLGVTQLAARDAQGRPLDLGLNAVQVKIDLAAQPAAGTAALETLELQAGPLALSARGRVEGLPRDGAALDPAQLAVQGGQFSADADLAPLLAAIAPLVDLHGLAAAGTVQVRAQADGSAGAVAGQAQVTVKGLALQGPDGLDVSVPGLTVDATASADERAIRLEHLVTRWEPLRAMTHAIPNGELAASATWTPADRLLDVPHWTLACPLAGGEGRLKATLGAAGAAEGAGIERLEAQVQLSGQVEPVREWLAALKPELQPARGEGQWDLTLTADVAGDRITAQPQLTLRGVGLKGYVVGGQELPLDKADVDFGAHIDFDRGAGSVKAEGLQLRAPGVELTASGQATNVLGDPTAATGALDCTWSLQPDVVTARLGALLGGLGLAGAPLSGSMRVELAPAGASAAGNLSGAEIAVTLPADAATGQPARTLVQRELKADFDLTASPWPSIDTLDVRRGEFRSSTAQATVAGRVERLSTPASASADVRFHLDAELARVLADLGPALGLPAWEASGAAVVEGKLTGDAGQLALTADGTIANCHMVLPAPAPPKSAPPVAPVAAAEAIAKPGGAGTGTAAGKPPIVIDEPKLTFGVTSQILVEPLDVTLERASIDSSFLRGKLDGKILALRSDTPRLAPLEGDFTYIPDTLGALLQPWLPVQWSGSAEQPLRFRVEGPVAKVDPVAMLGGLAADATVGLGQITAPGLTTGGQVDVKNHDGRTKVVGKLTANAGTLDLDADLDLRPEGAAPAATPPSSQVKVTLAGLQVTQELADLLARVHPLFARTAGSQVATVSGVIGADLSGTWAGPLPTSGEPPGGWLGAAAKSLTASGRLDAGQLQFASSALLGEMLSAVNLPGQTQLSLAPIEFRIEQGRLSYAQPWVVNLAGMDTNFTGSVGLDLSLDLAWNVPITEQLIAKHDFLKSLAGQTIEVPITGTATKPRLEWSDALKDLAARAAKAELEKKLKDKLGGLPSIPGVTDSGADASGGQPATSPEDLLSKADKLWDEGKHAEAKPLYQELIDKHKFTLTYTLNKKRIKERAESKS